MDGVKPKTPSALVRLPGVHEQEDGTILAVCATGTSSRYRYTIIKNHSVGDPNPGSGILCLLAPGSGFQDRLFWIPNPQPIFLRA